MLLALLILVALLVVIAVGVAVAVIAPLVHSLKTRSVIVNLRDGAGIRGIVMRDRGRIMILAEATLYEEGAEKDVDGQVVVRRDNISFVQVLP
jgi:small nuclear ribonucleoprotein (snRNP)-like protein